MSIGVVIALLFVVFIAMGVPIAVSIGIPSVVGLLLAGMPLSYIAQAAYTAVDSFTIIAVPMFILSGVLMEKGGLTNRLIKLASVIVGKSTGGLAAVTILACTFFAAISGSGPATTAAIGAVLIPAMIKDEYHREFAGGITACAGGIGVVIPPSIPMIMFAITAEVSVTGLFLAGIFPGLLLGAFLYIAVFLVSRKRRYASQNVERSWKNFKKALLEAKWALFAPILILGGIYSGIFTVTEASVVAVVYSFIVGKFVYKNLNRTGLTDALIYSARVAGTVMLVLTTGRIFGRLLTILQIPQAVSGALAAAFSNPVVLILMIDLLLLFVGMWMETLTQIIILTPLLLPVVTGLGIDPLQFGVMFTIACEVGYETPPLGVNLFVASELAETSIEGISKEAALFALVEVAALVLVSLIPQISLFIPRLAGFG